MIVPGHDHLHLSYCQNIHRGERWGEHLAAIDTHTRAVRERVAPGKAFGLGLRLGVDAAKELTDPGLQDTFKDYLKTEDLYPFTVNAFPYGQFHDTRVKEQVYAPDWRTDERVEYTIDVIDVLAELLPEGQTGSVSTVPASFKDWIRTEEDVEQMLRQVGRVAQHLEHLERERGIYIHLGLEPEPACYLETTPEMVAFYKRLLGSVRDEELIRRYIGVNFDCCHVALQFEDLEDSLDTFVREGILLSKIHISAALHLDPEVDSTLLCPFDEPVYLHQVKALLPDGSVRAWTDLPEALPHLPDLSHQGLRCHFHVPMFWEGNDGELGTTRAALTPGFFGKIPAATEHLEIETYTFDVMPQAIRKEGVVDNIVSEFDWVLKQF